MPTKAELLTELTTLAASAGPDITLFKFQEATGIGPHHVYRRWGNWTNLRTAAGLPVRTRRPLVYSDDELFTELTRTGDACQRFPTTTTFDRLSDRSWQTYNRRFGRKSEVWDRYRQWLDAHTECPRPAWVDPPPNDEASQAKDRPLTAQELALIRDYGLSEMMFRDDWWLPPKIVAPPPVAQRPPELTLFAPPAETAGSEPAAPTPPTQNPAPPSTPVVPDALILALLAVLLWLFQAPTFPAANLAAGDTPAALTAPARPAPRQGSPEHARGVGSLQQGNGQGGATNAAGSDRSETADLAECWLTAQANPSGLAAGRPCRGRRGRGERGLQQKRCSEALPILGGRRHHPTRLRQRLSERNLRCITISRS